MSEGEIRLLILELVELQIQEMREQMSKLTDAVTQAQSDLTALSTRVDAALADAATQKQADAATIAALQAENDSAATDVAGLSTAANAILPAPASAPSVPPAATTTPDASALAQDTTGLS